MNEAWWERPVCFLCAYWWLFLLLLGLGLTAFFTRALWVPAPSPTPTPLPTATSTALPSATPAPTLTPTLAPTATRVETLGTGDVQVTLLWSSVNDLDLWVTDPAGVAIYFNNRTAATGGELDVDANPGCQGLTSQPVENIFWPTGAAPRGEYVISVNYFQQCLGASDTAFTVRVLVDGQTQEFSGSLSTVGEMQEIHRFQR